MNKVTKSIAITIASLLSASTLAASAAIIYESKQCEQTMKWVHTDLVQFEDDVRALHRIWDKAAKIGVLGPFTYAKELIDARTEMDDSQKEADGSINLMQGVCNPFTPIEKLAAKVNPKAFNTRFFNEWYSEIIEEHNNKDWSY